MQGARVSNLMKLIPAQRYLWFGIWPVGDARGIYTVGGMAYFILRNIVLQNRKGRIG